MLCIWNGQIQKNEVRYWNSNKFSSLQAEHRVPAEHREPAGGALRKKKLTASLVLSPDLLCFSRLKSVLEITDLTIFIAHNSQCGPEVSIEVIVESEDTSVLACIRSYLILVQDKRLRTSKVSSLTLMDCQSEQQALFSWVLTIVSANAVKFYLDLNYFNLRLSSLLWEYSTLLNIAMGSCCLPLSWRLPGWG